MSMDLAKKTYSTTPDYFIAGTTVGIVTAAKKESVDRNDWQAEER